MYIKPIRLPRDSMDAMRDLAREEGISFSEKLQRVIKPYIEEEERFPGKGPGDKTKQTTFTWSEEEDKKFKELCKQNNIKFDEAMRYIINKHLANSEKSHT